MLTAAGPLRHSRACMMSTNRVTSLKVGQFVARSPLAAGRPCRLLHLLPVQYTAAPFAPVAEETISHHTSTSAASSEPALAPYFPKLNYPGVTGPWATRSVEFDQSLPTGLAVTWLGTSSGRPTANRNVSCTVVRMPDCLMLVDCGEGSVRQLEATGLDLKTIERVFITHMHGDHVFGLPGLLRHLSSVKASSPPDQRHVYVYGPPGLVEFVRTNFSVRGSPLNIQVTVTEFVSSKQAHLDAHPLPGVANMFQCQQGPDIAPHVPQLQSVEQIAGPHYGPLLSMMRRRKRLNPRAFDKVSMQPQGDQAWYVRCSNGALVGAAQLLHRVPCWGYAMYEPPPARKQRPRKVVVLGDTMNSSAIAPLAWGADMLAHEATFAQGMEHKAYEAFHSTAWMAGLFARSVKARQLVLTHFSSRYDVVDLDNQQSASSVEDDDLAPYVLSEEIERLLGEARDAYDDSHVCAASDFFTFHVPAATEPAQDSTPQVPISKVKPGGGVHVLQPL